MLRLSAMSEQSVASPLPSGRGSQRWRANTVRWPTPTGCPGGSGCPALMLRSAREHQAPGRDSPPKSIAPHRIMPRSRRDTPMGAREFQKFLIAKQREIAAVVSTARELGDAKKAVLETLREHYTGSAG